MLFQIIQLLPVGNGKWCIARAVTLSILRYSSAGLTWGFTYLSAHSWALLALMKPVSSLFITQKNNRESGDHVAAVTIFPKENKNYVLLTMLVVASSRAANLIPIFLTPKNCVSGFGEMQGQVSWNHPPFTEHFRIGKGQKNCISAAWWSLSIWYQSATLTPSVMVLWVKCLLKAQHSSVRSWLIRLILILQLYLKIHF